MKTDAMKTNNLMKAHGSIHGMLYSESKLSFKELERRKKEMDENTNMEGPYSLSSLDLTLFGEEYEEKQKKKEEEKKAKEEEEKKKRDKEQAINEIIKEIEIFKNRYGAKMARDRFFNRIIKTKDPMLCLEFAKTLSVALSSDDLEKISDVILESEDIKISLEYTRNFKMKLKEFENLFLNSDDLSSLVYFAYYVEEHLEEQDIKKIEEKVFKSNNLDAIINFCHLVKCSDIRQAQKIVYNSNNYEKIIAFARNVKGANIRKAEQIILSTKNPKYCRLFALDVEDADIEKLNKYVEDTDCDDYKYHEVYTNYKYNILPRENEAKKINKLIKELR